MKSTYDKFQRYRLLTSYVSVIISVSLVLFLVGILSFLLLNTKLITNHFKERMTITVFLNDDVREAERIKLQKLLSVEDYTKDVEFVSKDEAAIALQKDIGESFIEFLGENPLKNSIDIYLKADYVNANKIPFVVKDISSHQEVYEVTYDKPIIFLLNENSRRISFWIGVVTLIFGLISILLINSSIRLSIYAHRFVIKTMQLVGAHKAFIRRPFILNNLKLGAIGGALASLLVVGFVYQIDGYISQITLLDSISLTVICIGIILLGILITCGSTFFAAQRFLNLRTENLY